MAPLTIGLLGLAGLVALIAIRIPIAYAMITVGAVGIAVLSGPAVVLNQLKDLAYGQFSIYDLSVVPLFILMGALAARSGLSADLFRAAHAWLGWMRGGVAIAAVAACAGFGAVCGSSLATASTMGRVALPQLRRYRYSDTLATGTIAAGGVLGILIPPSVVLVVYSVIVEANVVTMFAAALIPGLIAVLFFAVTIRLVVTFIPNAGPPGDRAGRQERIDATMRVLPVGAHFLVVIGGIYFGFFNPTPAAAVGVVMVVLFGAVGGRLKWRDGREALLETARTTGMIFLILLGAELLKIFMARGGVPQATAEWLALSGLSPMVAVALLLVCLIALGCLMDSLSMVLLAVPFFWPVIVGINGGDFVSAADSPFGMTTDELKIWFGILALIVVELGLITPPVGMNVFVIASQAPDVPMRRVFVGVLPFFGAEIVRVAVLMAFPALALWLPRVLSG
ncbi:MAG: TRAP transporter large permease [Pseudomonadota bacterium]